MCVYKLQTLGQSLGPCLTRPPTRPPSGQAAPPPLTLCLLSHRRPKLAADFLLPRPSAHPAPLAPAIPLSLSLVAATAAPSAVAKLEVEPRRRPVLQRLDKLRPTLSIKSPLT
jgi:hypothetical protein